MKYCSNVCRHMESVNHRILEVSLLIAYCVSQIVTCCFMGSLPCTQTENIMLQCLKNMEFRLQIRAIPIYVFCKFEMLTFKMARVIKHYELFAFLFVQTSSSNTWNVVNTLEENHWKNISCCLLTIYKRFLLFLNTSVSLN